MMGGWPLAALSAGSQQRKREQLMNEITLIGLDLAMNRKEDYQRMAAAA